MHCLQMGWPEKILRCILQRVTAYHNIPHSSNTRTLPHLTIWLHAKHRVKPVSRSSALAVWLDSSADMKQLAGVEQGCLCNVAFSVNILIIRITWQMFFVFCFLFFEIHYIQATT